MVTLAKFGIPLDGNKLSILQPNQKYRFRVIWQNFGENNGLTTMTQNVVTVTRPKFGFEDIKLDSYNSVAWIQGKHTFDPIEITLRDDITNAVASSVGAQIQKQMNFFEQTSAVAGVNYKFTMEIHTLDGTDNEATSIWVLEGCFLTGVQYPEGDYASGDPNMITLTVRFDNATNVAGPNNQNSVGGNPFPNTPSPSNGSTFG